MNLYTIAQTLRDNAITLKAQFYNDINKGLSREYTFLALKEDNFRSGDYVAVRTGTSDDSNLKIVRVTEVHDTAEVDLDAQYEYQWAFDKVDVNKLSNRRAQDQAFHVALRKEQQRTTRQRALETLGVDGDNVQRLAQRLTEDEEQ